MSNLGRGFVSGTAEVEGGSRRLCLRTGALPVMGQNLEKVGNTAPFALEDGQAEGSSAVIGGWGWGSGSPGSPGMQPFVPASCDNGCLRGPTLPGQLPLSKQGSEQGRRASCVRSPTAPESF